MTGEKTGRWIELCMSIQFRYLVPYCTAHDLRSLRMSFLRATFANAYCFHEPLSWSRDIYVYLFVWIFCTLISLVLALDLFPGENAMLIQNCSPLVQWTTSCWLTLFQLTLIITTSSRHLHHSGTFAWLDRKPKHHVKYHIIEHKIVMRILVSVPYKWTWGGI